MEQINGYDHYFITEDGTMFSTKKGEPTELKSQKASQSKKKYLQIRLYHEGVYKFHYIHRLMWETYVGPIPEDKQIDHIDGDTMNNRISNLQLVTARQNVKKHHKVSNSAWYRSHRDQFIKDYEELGTYAKVAQKWKCSASTAWYVINNRVLVATVSGGSYYTEYKED